MRTSYRKWTEHIYPGEKNPPKGSPGAGYWPMFFISRGRDNDSYPFRQRIQWRIKYPNDIDWGTELFTVEQTLKSLTTQQIRLAQYEEQLNQPNELPLYFSVSLKSID
ncbi:hypothetical protein [Peribacillus cavernae]|uniref:hypothetical protein n=1 Tax=Peribacillus cavernae TaxID=1674310 RepID=UPI001FE6DB9D|nr:hypothetical protein [Peribacillus cavernae]MDQ0219287.1 hypothetical protein [Peribacillus cavernae]